MTGSQQPQLPEVNRNEHQTPEAFQRLMEADPYYVGNTDATAWGHWMVIDMAPVAEGQRHPVWAIKKNVVQPGLGNHTSWHRHPFRNERFYVTQGVARFRIGDGESILVPAGGTAFAPAGVAHEFGNGTEDTLCVIMEHHEAALHGTAEADKDVVPAGAL